MQIEAERGERDRKEGPRYKKSEYISQKEPSETIYNNYKEAKEKKKKATKSCSFWDK